MEGNIIKEIKEFDKNNLEYISTKINNIKKNILLDYLNSLKDEANFRYIEAYDQQDIPISGLCFQICTGPLPQIPTFFKCGSIWGFWGDNSSLEILILTAIYNLKKEKLFKILTYSYNEEIGEILKKLSFSHSNAL